MIQDKLVRVEDLLYLAACFNLPCIVRDTEITVMGTKQILIFKRQEKETCQLIQII